MVFEDFSSAQSVLLWSSFVIALLMGAVITKTNFCTMGAVSDLVNMGDTGRFRAWMLAAAIATIGVTLLEALGAADPSDAFPPYRMGQLLWAENLLGGLMFGIGMTLASGCGNKALIRIGGGNLKSVMVLLVIGLIAYFMVNPLPGSDETLMSILFLGWLRPLAVDLGPSQDLGTLLSKSSADHARLAIGLLIGIVALSWIFRAKAFRSDSDNIAAGICVGLAVILAWNISSSIRLEAEGEQYSLSAFVQDWDFLSGEATEGATKPNEYRPLSPQSYTFINPMGQTLGYAARGFNEAYLTFGVMAVFGVIAGALLWSLISKAFRIEWFASKQDFFNHLVGAVLMGFGGVLGMGCTIGQGITGVSTLALGSFITLAAIILGSAMTMKIQYYRMVYEDAGFAALFLTSLVDLRLLPKGLRKLDAI